MMQPQRAHFRAMGTEVELLALPELPPILVEAVRARFEFVEAHLSRFRPESELSRLNASGGKPFKASTLLRTVLEEALAAARHSGGLFDPTALGAVEAAGYRESFEKINGPVPSRLSLPRPDYRQVVVHKDGNVELRRGLRIDLGGFAKGWTVDDVASIMRGLAGSWIVNAGGDLRAAGPGPDGSGWLVGVEDPLLPERDLGVIEVRNRAVATSTTARRRWLTTQGWSHHLIDPSTGRPSQSDVASVTVLSNTTAEAEVLAKTLLLLGAERGIRYIESREGCEALFALWDGSALWSRKMEALRVA